MSAIQDLINRYQADQQAANEANERRYAQLTSMLEALMQRTGTTHDDIAQGLDTQGRAARRAISQNAQRQSAQAAQNLTTRGLGNTTITATAERGVQEDATANRQALEEQLFRQRAGLLQNRIGSDIQTTGMLAQAVEGRNDIGPDLGQFLNLMQAAGQAGSEEGGSNRPNFIGGVPANSLGGNYRGSAGGGGGGGGGSRGGGYLGSGGGSGGGRTGVRTFTNAGQVSSTGGSRGVRTFTGGGGMGSTTANSSQFLDKLMAEPEQTTNAGPETTATPKKNKMPGYLTGFGLGWTGV